jgi:two-component SAPR family response regulator
MASMPAKDRANNLAGCKVLIVEDEMLVAINYCQGLSAAGAEIVGPFNSVAQALKCVETAKIDVAVLDYALTDETSDPLQTALEDRGIPFVVLTGYPRVLVRRHAQQKVLTKPISPELLCRTVRDCRG